MNVKLLFVFSILLFLLAPLALAQWVEDVEKGEGTISIPVVANQWVLIGMNTDIPGGLSSTSEIKLEDIKAGWLWDAEKQDYVVHIANGKNVLEAAPTGNAGFWVLPIKSGTLDFKVDLEISKDRQIIDRINLEDGFNFVYITPSILGRSMGELGRNCNLLAMYAFIPELQQWTPLPLDTLAPPQSIGRSVLVENSGTCSLTSQVAEPSQPLQSPPQLPPKTTPTTTSCPETGLACSVDCPEDGELEDGTPCENGVWNETSCECKPILPTQAPTSTISPTQTPSPSLTLTPSPSSPTSNMKASGEPCSQNSECQSAYCRFSTPRVCS